MFVDVAKTFIYGCGSDEFIQADHVLSLAPFSPFFICFLGL